MRVAKTLLIGASISAVVLAIGGCPGGGGGNIPGGGNVPGGGNIPGGGGGEVNPDGCGSYAASDAGRKIKAFLTASQMLHTQVTESEEQMKGACVAMGQELGMTSLDGKTGDVCKSVIEELRNHLQVGMKAEAKLDINYEPARCEVNADVAASAAAKCEAQASADVAVQCSGTCQGTCQGACQGTCQGETGEGGECNGQCDGTCQGTCQGECVGSADVDASAECEAHAEVEANVKAECTKPELEINYDASLVVDKAKVEAAVAAIKAGIPELLMVGAKIQGPVKAAFTTWAKTARELKSAAGDISQAFKDQAMCVSGQLVAAAALIAQIEVSIEVQVEVSAEANASVGG